MTERVRRWWHFQACYWLGQHAPAGLVFTCVLITYDRCLRERGLDITADYLLNESGRWAERAVKKGT